MKFTRIFYQDFYVTILNMCKIIICCYSRKYMLFLYSKLFGKFFSVIDIYGNYTEKPLLPVE